MNNHVGWTKDGKCVLCLSSDSTKTCTGFSEDADYMGKIIARGLNVQKELSSLQSQSLADEMHKFESDMIKKLQDVKEYMYMANGFNANGCSNHISDHKCAGVVPGTFVVCGEDDYQYCSDACLNIARHTKEIKNQTEDHPLDCAWWKDWHSCSCGAFNKK